METVRTLPLAALIGIWLLPEASLAQSAIPTPAAPTQLAPAAPAVVFPDAAAGAGPIVEPGFERRRSTGPSTQPSPSVLQYSFERSPPASISPTPLAPARLTLRDAVLASFERSGSVSASRGDLEAALASIDVARARTLPQLDAFLRGGIVRSGQDRDTFDQTEGGLTLTTTLYDWGAGSDRIAGRRAIADGAAAKLDDAVDTLGFEVIDTYYDVLLQRDQLRVGEWALSEARKFAADLEGPVAAGALAASLAANAAALVAQQEAALTTTIRNLRQTEAKLAVLAGFEPGDLVDPRVFGRPFGNVEHAVALAIGRSPAVAEAAARTRAAQAERRATRAEDRGRLTLDAEAAVGRNAGGNADARLDGSISATYRIPLFDGGLRDAQAALTESDVAAAGGREVAARHQVEIAVRRAWAVHETASDLRRQEERAVAALELALSGFAAEMQAGQRQPSELPALVTESADAQRALATYYYGEQLAVLHLYRHTADAWAVLGVDAARKALVETARRPGSLLPVWFSGLLQRVGG